MPFFSIVIPVYNRSDLIAETVKSVLDQQYRDFELVLVNDGSTDDTAIILEKKFGTLGQVSILTQENKERGAARNAGFHRASGEYVVFFDSDDRMHANHLGVMHAMIVKNNFPDFIATKFQILREGKILESDISRKAEGYYDYHLFLDGNPLACNVGVRKKNTMLHLFEEDRTYAIKEDWLFFIRNLMEQKLFLVDQVTITLNDHAGRSMRSESDIIVRKTGLAYQWILDHTKLKKEELRIVKGHCYYLSAVHCYADNKRKPAFNYLRLALRLQGLRKKNLLLLIKIIIGRKLLKKLFL